MDHILLISLGLAGGAFGWTLKLGASLGALEARVKSLELAQCAMETRVEARMDRLESKIDKLLARGGDT